jgi:hypothetical protein
VLPGRRTIRVLLARMPSPLRVTVPVAALALLTSPSAFAFCVYNDTGGAVSAHVHDGNFGANVAAGGNACCNWSNGSCNPSRQRTNVQTVQIETDSFICYLPMQSGGYATVEQQDRSALGLPPNLYCASYDVDGTRRAVSDPFVDRGLGADARDVRFLVTADPQYDNANPTRNDGANQTFQTIRSSLINDDEVRGVLIAGDLTQNAEPTPEYSAYQSAISGYARYFYESEGNHDVVHPSWECTIFSSSCSRTIMSDLINRKRANPPTQRDGGHAHYSWDWHDVHFVQLGLYGGNGTVAEQYDHSDPGNSLDFLRNDLAQYVGQSGRPVILIQHYGFDDFSTGRDASQQVWWSDAQRAALWDVLAPYNVVAIFAGHIHLAPGDGFQFPFNRPAGRSNGPASIPSFVSGATFNGIFLDVTLDARTMTIVRRNQSGGEDSRVAVPIAYLATARK